MGEPELLTTSLVTRVTLLLRRGQFDLDRELHPLDSTVLMADIPVGMGSPWNR